jgi:hypothetical protein
MNDAAGQVDLLAEVRRREEAATTALARAAGNTSLCALSRSGASHPAVKFHEGAAAALAQVRRLLTRQTDAPSAGAIDAVREDWNDQNAALAQRSRDWAAYHAGGLEALDGLAELVQRAG